MAKNKKDPKANSTTRLCTLGLICLALFGCSEKNGPEKAKKEPPVDNDRNEDLPCDEDIKEGDLVINELVAKNSGVWIDENGATEDFLELVNASERTIDLWNVSISDKSDTYGFAKQTLEPGERSVFWADNDVEDGPQHLPFKLSSEGETIRLFTCGKTIDEVDSPQLSENESWSRYPDIEGDFEICRYATPAADNGDRCKPPQAVGLKTEVSFSEFNWPSSFPELPDTLLISELALKPASFVEIENTSDSPIDLTGFSLRISPIFPGDALPDAEEGSLISLDEMSLQPGERMSVSVSEEDVAALASDPHFEGIISLFNESNDVLDRVDFMNWPDGASLARPTETPERLVFCEETSPNEANDCTMLKSRDVGDRVRYLRTHGDFSALAQGGTHLSTESVKAIVDVVQGRAVHLLSARTWPLHYTFVREVVYGQPPLNRCDASEKDEFNQGWYEFSVTEYFNTVGRSFFLSTLVKHGAAGHHTVEFTPGDEILGDDMEAAFFTIAGHTLEPDLWFLRPQDDNQVEKIQPHDGDLPLLPPNAPFSELIYQPLTQGEGFGVLTFVPASDLRTTALGSQIILVTDDVPNDIPLTGGLITGAFQTPLAHVNILSQNRGTPNMALRDVLDDKRISSHLGKLVRLVVEGNDFTIEEANPAEAQAFWDSFGSNGQLLVPRLDTSQRDLVDLSNAGLESIPQIGAKASQMAELYQVQPTAPSPCSSKITFEVPRLAFAIPVVHFLEHFEKSGASNLLDDAKDEQSFIQDPLVRAEQLARVRDLIKDQPVDEDLLTLLQAEISDRFNSQRIRLRSSSNAEDLPGFNGAGLYTSESAELGSKSRPVADALRKVWASLYSSRAFDERELAGVDHTQVAMGVLVHQAFPEEKANGVGVSRNVLDPIRGDMYYLNIQAGEASVTNPAPGVSTEELTYQWPTRTPRLNYQSWSSLTNGEPIFTAMEVDSAACALRDIHNHFRPLIDPDEEDNWFAMEIEFKLEGAARDLIVKQARPHAFSGYEIIGDCREL